MILDAPELTIPTIEDFIRAFRAGRFPKIGRPIQPSTDKLGRVQPQDFCVPLILKS